MTEVEYDICETQMRIYEYYAKHKYDMKIFSNEYLSCDFCKRAMDTKYSRFQLEDVGECSDFFLPEIEDKLLIKNDIDIPIDIVGWIGFTYRQLYFETKILSKNLCQIVTFDDMIKLYPGMHTIDENDAGERIVKMFRLYAL